MKQLIKQLIAAGRRIDGWTFAALVAIGIFIFLRLWRLGSPAATVFDEVYFPKMAYQYLTGEAFFDIHPPLGKLMIAAAEIIAGNTPIGWRLMSAITGVLMLPAAYWATSQIFNDRRAGLIAALLVAMDGLFIVYARTGLMDGFMLLFGLAALGFTWQWRRAWLNENNASLKQSAPLFLAGAAAGLALAVKWIGVGFLPLVGAAALLTLLTSKTGRPAKKLYLYWAIAFIAIPLIVYTLPFLANWRGDFWAEFADWHRQSWNYNVHLDATHPYSSQWWSWPFLIRPIWFYYQSNAGIVTGVDGLGNPLVWWGGTLAIVYSLLVVGYQLAAKGKLKQQLINSQELAPLLFVLAGWAIFYLPWAAVGRVLFLYHYFGSYLFAILVAAWWLSQSFKAARSRLSVAAVLSAAAAVALAFAPIWIAYPIPQAWFDRLMWFKTWI